VQGVVCGVSEGSEGGCLGDFSAECMLSVRGGKREGLCGLWCEFLDFCDWDFAFAYLLDAPTEVARQARNDGFFRRLW